MSRLRFGLSLISPFAVLCATARAQTPAPAGTADETVTLNPFNVQASDTEGYRAASSASGLPFVVPLDRTPLQISVLTPEFLRDTGSFKVEDALRYVSGVANGERNEYGTEKFVIRGFRTNSVFVNGTPMNSPSDTSVIERVEVLKGPSTIVYGALDPAGLVNVITKRANFLPLTNLSGTWAEYGSHRETLDVNRPLNSGTGPLRVAGRLVATWNDEGSYLPNQYLQRWIFAPSLRVDVAKKSSLEFNYIATHEDGASNRLQTPLRNLSEPSTFANGYLPAMRDFTWVTPNDQWYLRSRYFNAQWSQEITPSLHTFVSYAQSSLFNDQYFFLGTANIVPNAAGQYLTTGRMTTQITQRYTEVYTAKAVYDLDFGGVQNKLALIARRTAQTLPTFQYAYQDSRDPVLGPYLVADASGAKAVSFPGLPRQLLDPYSPFASPILGNVRAADRNRYMNWTAGVTDYVTTLHGKLNVLGGFQYSSIREQNRHATVPQIGAVYTVIPGLNLYGLYSETFAPNVRSNSADPTSPFLPPEEGRGGEVGFKVNMLQDKLTGSVAAYEIKRSNVAQTLAGVITNGVNLTIPSGEEKSNGVEVDLLYRPVAGLNVNLAYAYTDAIISGQAINTDNPDLNGDGRSDAIGLKKEGVALHDVRLWTRYDFPRASALKGFSVGGGYTWRQGPIQQFGTFLQRKIVETSSPRRLDLEASYHTEMFSRGVDFRINCQNATDETYRDRRGLFVIPRTFMFTVDLKL